MTLEQDISDKRGRMKRVLMLISSLPSRQRAEALTIGAQDWPDVPIIPRFGLVAVVALPYGKDLITMDAAALRHPGVALS